MDISDTGSPAQRSLDATLSIGRSLRAIDSIQDESDIPCGTCGRPQHPDDLLQTEESDICHECHEEYVSDMMGEAYRMIAASRSVDRVGCSGCDKRHDRDQCPYSG